ncbi:MAG: TetR/AcrR family transcriptional regulator [Casimicrobiaceae bacterium]
MTPKIGSNAKPARTVKAATKDAPLIQERRDRLISAAIEVFKEKGFHAATTRDIGRAANMTQGTIYNYVSSKDDILYLVCDRLVAQYQEETHRALETIGDPVERVRSAARAVVEIMYHHQDEILLIYQNSYLLDRRSLHVILARVEGFVQIFEKLLRDAAHEAGVELQDSYLAAHIFTFMPTMIALRRWGVARIGAEKAIPGIADFLVRGMGFVVTPRKPGADGRGKARK